MELFFYCLGIATGMIICFSMGWIFTVARHGGYQPDGRGRKLNPNPPQGGTARTPHYG